MLVNSRWIVPLVAVKSVAMGTIFERQIWESTGWAILAEKGVLGCSLLQLQLEMSTLLSPFF